MIDEIKRHHRWIGVIYYFTESFPRVLRVTALATNMIAMLFVQSITYNLMNKDDGTCSDQTTEQTCLSLISPYAVHQDGRPYAKCAWYSDKSVQYHGYCTFIEPNNSVVIVLFVAVVSALLATPITITADKIIRDVLSRPEKEESNSSFLSIGDSVASNKRVSRDSRIGMDKLKELLDNISKLSSDIQSYRHTLNSSQRKEFDCKSFYFIIYIFYSANCNALVN
jgi:hypothetical protein